MWGKRFEIGTSRSITSARYVRRTIFYTILFVKQTYFQLRRPVQRILGCSMFGSMGLRLSSGVFHNKQITRCKLHTLYRLSQITCLLWVNRQIQLRLKGRPSFFCVCKKLTFFTLVIFQYFTKSNLKNN